MPAGTGGLRVTKQVDAADASDIGCVDGMHAMQDRSRAAFGA
jgi:hypothetical protein